MNLRPSRLIAAVENGVIATARGVRNTSKRAAKAVSIEYRARKRAEYLEDIERDLDKARHMSPAEQAAFSAEQAIIEARMAEILARRTKR